MHLRRLKIDSSKRSSHSFAPLLFFLCDSESEENYAVAFRCLEDITSSFYGQQLAPDIVRGDHHQGLLRAVHSVWPNARYCVCRTHAYQSVREASVSMSPQNREKWLSAWRLLEQCASQNEFDALLPAVSSVFRHYFADDKAARILEREWGSGAFRNWHICASGVPLVPPDNNALESYQRILTRCLGHKPQPMSALLPSCFRRVMQREVSQRRDSGEVSEKRIPWFLDASSLAGAKEIVNAYEAGITNILPVDDGKEVAICAGEKTSEALSHELIRSKRAALEGRIPACATQVLAEDGGSRGPERAQEFVKSYVNTARAVHLVSFHSGWGAPAAIDGMRCTCKGWWDHGQCRHILAIAHVQGRFSLHQTDAHGLRGRTQERRPAKVKQPSYGQVSGSRKGHQANKRAVSTRELEEVDVESLAAAQTLAQEGCSQQAGNNTGALPVVSRASDRRRTTRPKESERGRGKQRGKKSKKGN